MTLRTDAKQHPDQDENGNACSTVHNLAHKHSAEVNEPLLLRSPFTFHKDAILQLLPGVFIKFMFVITVNIAGTSAVFTLRIKPGIEKVT